jgi:hypothetical protein
MKNKTKIVEALKALKKPWMEYDKAKKEYVDIEVSPTVIERDSKIIVSAEDGLRWADYYGEFEGGYQWIEPVLEAFAKEHGLHWEWNDPGSISLWD